MAKLSEYAVEEIGRSFLVDGRDGRFFTDSRVVAKAFGKRHDNVLRDIRTLECSEQFNRLNFEGVEYQDEKGEVRPYFRMTRDGFSFLAMGFRGRAAATWKERFIATFNRAVEIAQSKTIKPLTIPFGEPRVPSATRYDIVLWVAANQDTYSILARTILGYLIGSAGDLPAELVAAFDEMQDELADDRARYPRRRYVTRRVPLGAKS